ncbi:MAG TPA: MerR family transcriptional regulator [Polaromonas sp.]|uniref:MerR family transcriptional regulator n=1 Tax=Polaromonas sp. TaxID=1869339 RepID=UPI002D5295CF|nr:MerR family transcriptional regulator [Polaromonas sp.]HYW56235.1 MerR family transcriptional regulator [Polaromonas sp.]
MFIGEIARLTGASPKAVRHYEGLGLLGKVNRAGSYRVYSDDDVRQVKLIRQAQALGFRLADLHLVLQGDSNQPDWDGLSQQIARKRESIQQEINGLRSLDEQLKLIDAEIRSCPDTAANIGQACEADAPLRRKKSS